MGLCAYSNSSIQCLCRCFQRLMSGIKDEDGELAPEIQLFSSLPFCKGDAGVQCSLTTALASGPTPSALRSILLKPPSRWRWQGQGGEYQEQILFDGLTQCFLKGMSWFWFGDTSN